MEQKTNKKGSGFLYFASYFIIIVGTIIAGFFIYEGVDSLDKIVSFSIAYMVPGKEFEYTAIVVLIFTCSLFFGALGIKIANIKN